MYSRSYLNQKGDIVLPEKYDGTALSEKDTNEPYAGVYTVKSEQREEKTGEDVFVRTEKEERVTMIEQNKEKPDKNSDFSALFSALPIKSILSGIGFEGLKMPSLDAEDILILGIALYFFFSKTQDKLLALMLIALLFI